MSWVKKIEKLTIVGGAGAGGDDYSGLESSPPHKNSKCILNAVFWLFVLTASQSTTD